MADVTGDLWRAVTGRAGGRAPENVRDAVDRLEQAGASKKDLAQFKKDLAAALGVTVRQVQRMTTRTGSETRSDKRHAGRIREFVQKDSRVRAAAGSQRRKSRMRNKGAKLKIKGRQGPKVGKSWPTRDRLVELDLDPYEMEALLDAWENGDDDTALETLQDALEDEGYPPNWSWEDGAAVEFLGLSYD
ncbi:hypothetical protein [Krasilnikovia sp. M28-CT-15]|uniref:hypothetical protein n=1 Tax=Krasilnikovia sp. M28-CT-15 TaxID=3373540 RepID=UPI003876E3EE